jgi:hypothetical protein
MPTSGTVTRAHTLSSFSIQLNTPLASHVLAKAVCTIAGDIVQEANNPVVGWLPKDARASTSKFKSVNARTCK